jgi:hypothetical protein
MRLNLTILLAILLSASVAWAKGPVGFVAAAQGDARVNSQAARVGMEVFSGDRLVTGEKSRLKVLFSDDAILALGSQTEVVVARHLFDPKSGARSTRLDLLKGTLRSLVQKMVAGNRADFEVKTTNAVAGVRGTEFVLVADGEATRLYTYSGEVQLSGGGGQGVLVAAGQGSNVGGEGEAHRPEAVAAAVLTRLREATDTRQNPQAVAWNLELGKADRLVAGAGGVDTAEEGELNQEALPATDDPELRDTNPKIEPCVDCTGDFPEGQTTVSNGFGADDVRDDIGAQSGPLDGNWSPENGIDFDPGAAGSLTLRIVVHREHRR